MNIQDFFDENEREKSEQGKSDLQQPETEKSSSGAVVENPTVIPVIHETATVHKEMIESGKVRVQTRVSEVEKNLEIPLVRENYEIKRVPVDEFIDEHPSIREEGDSIIIPVVEEVVVVQKKLKLVEEVHLVKRQITETHKETVTLKQEEIRVERIPAGNNTGNKI